MNTARRTEQEEHSKKNRTSRIEEEHKEKITARKPEQEEQRQKNTTTRTKQEEHSKTRRPRRK